MFLNLIDKKLFENRYFYFSLLAIMQLSILPCYGKIPHLIKWILRERATEHSFLKVSFYKKPLRSKQISLFYKHFHTYTNHKKVAPLKLKRSHCTKGLSVYSPFHRFWQSFISIAVCRDCIPARASSCKKQLTDFFACLLLFLKVKHIS